MKCKLCGRKYTDRRRLRCNSCNTKIRRFRVKEAAVKYKGGKCIDCKWRGKIQEYAGFDFHHKKPGKKDFIIGRASNKKWEVVKKELDKCVLLCARCHAIRHQLTNNKFLKEVKSYHGRLLLTN